MSRRAKFEDDESGDEMSDEDVYAPMHADEALREVDNDYVAWEDKERTKKKKGHHYSMSVTRAAIWSVAKQNTRKKLRRKVTPADRPKVEEEYRRILDEVNNTNMPF
jgi:hypothetical protein